ncbi:MAG: hypothetical protein A2Y17_03150 [Clostridiales bacterium GWF2_38_85]|nr:MAG: hypothetical protein A2Y17_03150 [Clostridiales bacterium GWF2_38_85]
MKIIIKKSDQIREIEFKNKILISDAIFQSGFEFFMPCGGKQRCMKCRIQTNGILSEPTEKEKELLTDQEFSNGIRYACMTYAEGNAIVLLPDTVKESIMTDINFRSGIIAHKRNGYGIAIDLGTTTLAAYLFNLLNGELIDVRSERNPQTIFGSDVITRIGKSVEGQKQELADIIRSGISELCLSLNSTDEINSMVITGNTAMLYLLAGRDIKSISAAPFIADCLFGYVTNTDELGIKGINASVYLPDCVSAFIGADTVCAALSENLDTATDNVIIIDIGTNGEVMLKAREKLLCCSTAAGTAFEGEGITMGMTARDGAIYSISAINGELYSKTIGNIKSSGLCGTGIVDAVATLIDLGCIDETGLIIENCKYYIKYKDENSIKIIDDIVITQKDIRALQLAKAAICAGIETLIHYAKLSVNDIDRLIIAGGFGTALSTASAVKIGLIPKELYEKAYSVGNAAAAGAAIMLIDPDKKNRSKSISVFAETIELSTDTFFFDRYISDMGFSLE